MLFKNEIIEKYKVSEQSIKRKIASGELNPVKVKNKNVFDEKEVDSVFAKKDPIESLKLLLRENYGFDPYEFMSEYKDNSTKLTLKCNTCNNTIEVTPGNIKNNIRLRRNPPCKYCGIAASAKGHIKTAEEYNNDLITICNSNYKLIGKYINTKEKTLHECLICNFQFEVTPQNLLYSYNIKNKHYCPNCNKLIRDDRDYEERLIAMNSNIIPLEKYINRKTPILHKCNTCNHEWDCAPNSPLSGSGCPKCSNKVSQSKNEKEIIDFLISGGNLVETRNRTILNGKEIDILLPNFNIGIELNGNYWHSEKYKGKKYHLEKTELSESKNIKLIQIMDDEWQNKESIVKAKLNYLLKVDSLPKIYARKCTIREISSSIKNEFLKKNHIQGEDLSNIKLGMFYEDQLVSVMTFVKPRSSLGYNSLNKDRYDYELSRFASDITFNVVGGFSKLFKYFERNYTWNKILTYADRRWSTGNLYNKNGWIHLYNTKPNYWYVDKNLKTRYHRYNFRKNVLKEKFPLLYSDELTEFQIMDKTKYFRVWDCGNMVFEYSRN